MNEIQILWYPLLSGMIFFVAYTVWPVSKKYPKDKIAQQIINQNLVQMEQSEKLMLAQQELVNPTTTWVLFFFLGWSYGSMNQMGLQIAYYLTFGGLGIWTLYRLFTLNSAIKQYNNTVYMKYGLNNMIRS
jgi:hypothetical protein